MENKTKIKERKKENGIEMRVNDEYKFYTLSNKNESASELHNRNKYINITDDLEENQIMRDNLDLSNIFIFVCFNNSLSLETIEAFSFNDSARKSISFGCSDRILNASGILSEYSSKVTNLTISCKSFRSSSKFLEDSFALINISALCLSNSSKANSGENRSCPLISNFLINEPFQKKVNNEFVSNTSLIYIIPLDLSSFSLFCLANSPSLSASSSVNSEFSSNLSILFNNNALFIFLDKNSLIDSDQFISGNESKSFFNFSDIDNVTFGIINLSSAQKTQVSQIFKSFHYNQLKGFIIQSYSLEYNNLGGGRKKDGC